MTWIRHNWLALVVLAAIVGSFVISNSESKGRDERQAKQLVSGCRANSKRTALNARGWKVLAARVADRNHAGDAESAALYRGIGEGIAELVPAVPGSDIDALVSGRFDGKRLVLAPSALALQRAGCERLYHS